MSEVPFERGDIDYGSAEDSKGHNTRYHPLVVVDVEDHGHVEHRYYVVVVSSQMEQFRPHLRHSKTIHQPSPRIDPVTKFEKPN